MDPPSDPGEESSFHRIWPTTAIALGFIAAIAWTGFLGYAIIKLIAWTF
jgi:hypothetical protein